MLNLSNNNGSGNSYIRFAPQANAWTNRDGEEIQLKKVVMDLDSVQTGWLMIGAGVRDWQPDETLGAKSQSPGEGYKRGFVVTLYSKELGLVDWSSNAYGPCKGFEKISLQGGCIRHTRITQQYRKQRSKGNPEYQ